MSLNDALIAIVQKFVGSYNIPLLVEGKEVETIELVEADEGEYFNIKLKGVKNERI